MGKYYNVKSDLVDVADMLAAQSQLPVGSWFSALRSWKTSGEALLMDCLCNLLLCGWLEIFLIF